jgi:ABC-type proline/glycine betaine transport system permease subunit
LAARRERPNDDPPSTNAAGDREEMNSQKEMIYLSVMSLLLAVICGLIFGALIKLYSGVDHAVPRMVWFLFPSILVFSLTIAWTLSDSK